MKYLVLVFLLLSTVVFAKEKSVSIYDFNVVTIDGKEISMEHYKDKVLLIVNVASKCGFTPQYEELEKLFLELKDQGFMVLGFPCNQFASQEPEDEEHIKNFCQLNYGVSFDMFSKIDVNGENTSELYKFLKQEQSGILWSEAIKWNFTKFLVDRKGNVVARYAPSTSPLSIKEDIVKLLKH